MSQFEIVSLLAGGWSARQYDVLRLPGFVVGVNDAAIYGRVDAVVSMDRLWTEARWSHIMALRKPTWLRDAALKRITHVPGFVTRFTCDHTSAEMTDEPNTLNGTNSGLCGLCLCYQFRPRVLRLYGMDMSNGPNGERHWYPDYEFPSKTGAPLTGTKSGTFEKWKRDLDQALKQCRAVGINVEVMTARKRLA